MKTDLEIQQDVMNELKWNPFITASEIGVRVREGIVTLSGQVDSYAQKQEAERSAKKVKGVKAIAEDIQIGVSPKQKSDGEIAESVLKALKWHTAVPHEKITVKVENGNVTLEGEVQWEFQRNAAKNAISNLEGVKNIFNLLAIKPKVTAFDVKNKISSALHRSATVDVGRISVEVEGRKVILKGKVRSSAEKQDAEDAAWCAPGIAVVESHLQVEPELALVM